MVGGRWHVVLFSGIVRALWAPWRCPTDGRRAVRPSGRAGVDEDAHDKGLLSPECL